LMILLSTGLMLGLQFIGDKDSQGD
jgi:hypothetical protein